MELVAAIMAIKVDVSLRNNFGSSLSESVFWTDSWRFLPSSDNPADDGTCSSSSVSRWLTGPYFLQEPGSLWPQPPHSLCDLPAEFEIVKRTVAGPRSPCQMVTWNNVLLDFRPCTG